jgi:hypothetical protein
VSWAPTLPAAPSRPPVAGWFAYLVNQLTGIPSGEAFGALRVAPSQYVGLTGIPSGQAVGGVGLVYQQTVALSGIASAVAFGGSTFQPGAVLVSPQGIASGQAVGTPTVTPGPVTIAPGGVASGEAFGTATVTRGPVNVALSGIASGEAFGSPLVSYVVALTGIPSQASVGALSIAYAILTTGIPTGEAFGAATVIGPPQPIQLSGIASAEAFGGSAVQPGAVTIGLQGIASAAVFGTPTVTTGPVNVALSGIPSGEAVGALNVQQSVVLTGIASAESVGAALVTQTFPQDVALPAGIGTAEVVGTLTVTRGPVDIASVGGIATAEAIGSPTVMPSQFVIAVGGIASEEAFGTATVVPPTAPGPVPPTLIATTSVAGTGSTGTMPTHAIGDVLLAAAYVPGTGTSPATPSGWTSISYSQDGSGTNGILTLYWKRAVSSSTTHPVITGANKVTVQSWRGAGLVCSGVTTHNLQGTSSTLGYLAFNALRTDGSSYGLRFGSTSSTTNILTNGVPAGNTVIGGIASGLVGMQITSALTTSAPSATQALSASLNWESIGAELLSSDTSSGPVIMGFNASGATSLAIPEHAIGDLIVISASRASTTQATKPAAAGTVPAWVDIDAAAGANARSIRTAYFVATATNHTSGTWTNATAMSVTVIRGQFSTPIGGHATQNNASAASSVAPSITLTNTDGSSAILAIHAGVSLASGVPSGYARIGEFTTPGVVVNGKTVTTSVSTSSQPAGFAAATSAAQIEIRQH